MDNYEKILRYMRENNGIASSLEINKMGVDTKFLQIMSQRGQIERASRGVYVLPEAFEDEFYSLSVRCKKGIFSHDTALFLHDLTDRTPMRFSITLSAGYNPSSLKNTGIDFYYVKKEYHELGKITMQSPNGKPIFVYDMERTICDIVRSKERIDVQIYTDALKRYAKLKEKDLSKLIEYARVFKIAEKLREYMEVLI